jgi:ABC-type sugar transport system ATPase subunit
MDEERPLVEVKDCIMEFPGVKALNKVNFTLLPGECHGLVGENGAGKSTLVKCITGEYQMTSGELYINGELIKYSSNAIKEIQARGVAIVHQEFHLMSDMTGLENIFIGKYLTKGPFIDWKAMRKRVHELMNFLQCDVNLNVPVKQLRTAERQIIQLAKAVLNESKV